MARFYDNNTGDYVTKHPEMLFRKAFYIHGTISDPTRWDEWEKTVKVMNQIALPDHDGVDTKFNWEQLAGLLNDLEDRTNACFLPGDKGLVNYVLKQAEGFEEIVLIGHSHGGNVAIQAADTLATKNRFTTIYLITIGTPVFNMVHFNTPKTIDKLKLIKKTEVRIRSNYGYSDTTYYTYLNPENPANWGKNDPPGTTRCPIKHLSLYNQFDRVDGIALIGDIFRSGSRMTFNTSTFEYDKNVNIEIPSFQLGNEVNRVKYMNYCSHRISLLQKLHAKIAVDELSLQINIVSIPKGKGQDNTYIHKQSVEYTSNGYHNLPPLPNFKDYDINDYLEDNCPSLTEKEIKAMDWQSICHLFLSKTDADRFINKYKVEMSRPPSKQAPFEQTFNLSTMSKGISFNLNKIEEEIEKYRTKIESTKAFNQQTKKEHIINPYIRSILPVLPKLKYLGTLAIFVADGVDNHSFDTNSPELIQKAIDKGLIQPFPRVRREDVKREGDK